VADATSSLPLNTKELLYMSDDYAIIDGVAYKITKLPDGKALGCNDLRKWTTQTSSAERARVKKVKVKKGVRKSRSVKRFMQATH
jgi:hypothetical protein